MLLPGKFPPSLPLSKQKAASKPFLYMMSGVAEKRGPKASSTAHPNIMTLLTIPVRDRHTLFPRTAVHFEIKA